MIVRNYMSSPPVTIQSDDSDHTALRLMAKHTIHHIPVVTSDGQLVGILAERDLLLAASRYLQTKVDIEEVMNRDVVTATLDLPLTEAANLMVAHRIGCLPVVDTAQQVVGIITEIDLLRAFVEMTSA